MKLPYFKIGEAFTQAKDSFSSGSKSEKLNSTAKLVGKSVANIGMFAVEVGVETLKRTPEIAGKIAQEALDKRQHLMTDEQIDRARTVVERGNSARERRLEKELEKDRRQWDGE